MQTEEQLRRAEQKYDELTERLQDGSIAADPDRLAALMKEYKQLTPVVEAYRSYTACRNTLAELDLLLSDPDCEEELRALANEEKQTEIVRLAGLEAEISRLLMPENAADARDVIVEIRSGAGGEEAALFAHSLHRMYSMYAERQGWQQTVMNLSETELGGTKEVTFSLSGDHVYAKMKFESGVHRVQRVPSTESSGRIHTSTATVAVLPEADEASVTLDPDDVEIDIYRSSGAGGQHINKTDSAIRLTHKPTGIVVTCQDQRSQLKNKEKAFKVLYSKLYELEVAALEEAVSSQRRSQVGTGDRSERIRTYNYPQNRVTDHRIDLTLYKLEAVLGGDLDEIIDALITDDQARKLANNED